MNQHRQIWETYSSAWKAKTAEEKRTLFEQSLSKTCVYSDPVAQAQGWDELTAYMLEFHKLFPGAYFSTTEFIEHHDRSIAKWDMLDANNQKISDGVSYGEYNKEGQLTSMNGFFQVPDGSSGTE